MKCESAYLEQRDKDNLFGSRNSIEVKIHSVIFIKNSKIQMTDNGLYRRSKLDEQNLKLEDAKRNGYDTLSIGININTNLKGQSETMEKNIKRVKIIVLNK